MPRGMAPESPRRTSPRGGVHGAEVVLAGIVVHLVRLGTVADARAHHVGLPAPGDLLPDALPGPLQEVRLVRGGDHVGGDGRTPRGQLGQRRGLQVAVHGHGHRPRDRRGRHDQDVRPVVRGLGAQRVTLLHPEPVLLVDHHQAQVGELDLLLEQGVGADHDPGVAGEHVGQRGSPGGRPDRPGEQGHAGGVLGRAELAGLGQRAEHAGDRPVVLLGEHLGRGEQGRLAARVHHLEHGPDRDHRLARADLALQQPVHRVGAGQLPGDRLAHRDLPRGQGERQPRVELVGDAAVDVRARHGRHGRGGQPPLRQRGLQQERLVPLEPLPGPLQVGLVERPVDGADRLGPADEPVPLPELGRERVLTRVQRVQHGLDRPGDHPRAGLGAGRVDRDHLGGELGRQLRREVGVGRRPGQQFVLRVDQLQPGAEAGHGAREHADHAGHQRLDDVLTAGVAPEERQHQLGAVVGDDHLGPAGAVSLAGHLVRADVVDPGQHGDVVAFAQRGQVGQLAAGVVAARVVPEQVADRAHAEGGFQRLGRPGPQRPVQRFAERGHTWQHRSARRHLLSSRRATTIG